MSSPCWPAWAGWRRSRCAGSIPGATPGLYSASRELWSEDYHADLLRAIFRLTQDYPQIAGAFPFCFTDYRDPSKIVNGYWNELNLKGLVDYRRRTKRAYTAVQEAYAGDVLSEPAFFRFA